jgi:hypothetical protein
VVKGAAEILAQAAMGLSAVFGLLFAEPAVAQQQTYTIDTFAGWYIKPLIARHATMRFVSCYIPPSEPGEGGATAAIFFARGERDGAYVLFEDDGVQEQGATISRRGAPDANELMGGAQTHAIQRVIIRGLMKLRFRTVAARNLRGAILAHPAHVCEAIHFRHAPPQVPCRPPGRDPADDALWIATFCEPGSYRTPKR